MIKNVRLFLRLNGQKWQIADKQAHGKLFVYRHQALPDQITQDYLDKIGSPYAIVNNDEVEYAYVKAGVIRPVPIFYKIENGIVHVTDDITDPSYLEMLN